MNDYLLAAVTVVLPTDPLGTKFPTLGSILGVAMNLVFYTALAVASCFIIINGLKISSSGGDKMALQSAKKGLLWAFLGFFVVIGFRTIITVVQNLLGATSPLPGTIPSF